MAFKNVQMGLRSLSMLLMMFGLYFHWESEDLRSTPHFIISGVLGSFIAVNAGLVIESSMNRSSDNFIIIIFLGCGIVLNVMISIISFIEFGVETSKGAQENTLNKGIISILSVAVYFSDLLIINCYGQAEELTE